MFIRVVTISSFKNAPGVSFGVTQVKNINTDISTTTMPWDTETRWDFRGLASMYFDDKAQVLKTWEES